MSVTFGAPTFSRGVDSVTAIASGSLKNNNLADIVVAGVTPGTSTGAVGIYLNQGGGSFHAPTLIPINGQTGGVALGDFLNNGKLDIAVVNATTGTLNILLNDGSGNFSPGVGAGIGSVSSTSSISAGDFNGDGKVDVVVASGPDNVVSAFLSRGDQFGSFVGGATVSIPSPTRVIAADLNGDGRPDLAVASGANPGAIYISLNDGNGNFGTPTSYAIGTNIQSANDLAVADFTGDNHPDIVGLGTQAGTNAGVAGVLPNNGGDGTFGTAVSSSVSTGAVAVAAANIAGNGHIDIAAISSTGGLDVVTANGAFLGFDADQPVFTTELGAAGGQAIATDINGDGEPDIAYISGGGGFGVTLNTSSGTFPPPVTNPTSPLTPTVTGTLPPGPVVAGVKIKPIRVKVTLVNSGAAPIDGKVTVNLLLSTSKTGNVGDPAVATPIVRNRLTFKYHQSRSFFMVVRQLPDSARGAFFLVAQVTDPSQHLNAGGTDAAITAVAPTVDLSGNFVLVPATAQVGRRATLAFNVINSGTISAIGTLEMKVYASQTGLLDGSQVVINDVPRRVVIRAGKFIKIRLGKTLPQVTAGPNYLIVQLLDPNSVFHDINVSNNVIVSPTAVQVG